MGRRALLAVFLALLLGLVTASPAGRALERSMGLGLLYELRGPLAPPPGAMVIALDQTSLGWMQRNLPDLDSVSSGLSPCMTSNARQLLEQSRNIHLVPRALYTCLLGELSARGARVVAIDVKFNAERPDDGAFAEALAHAGNVFLLEGFSGTGLPRLVRPTPQLAEAARGTGAFLSDGVDGRIATGYAREVPHFPETPILPIEAWRFYIDMPTAEAPRTAAIEPVWYYGGPLTIPTLSVREVFEHGAPTGLPKDMRDIAVFVGASDPEQPNAEDHFALPMPVLFGDMVGGVEIAATAFLNLLHDERLSRPSALVESLVAQLGAGLLLFTGLCLSGRRWVLVVLLIGALYTAAVALAFTQMRLWLPLFVPVFLGTPLALLSGMVVRTAAAREIVRRLLPRPVAERWLSALEVKTGAERLESASIMFIDLQGFTAIAERLDPQSLEAVLSLYYDNAAEAVERHDGMVIEFKGDGVLALFNETVAGAGHADKACRAALAASRGVHRAGRVRFPAVFEGLRIRFGIHSGEVTTGMVGSQARSNFNALGDSMNVAARIEEYGKRLSDDRDVILLSGATQARRHTAAGRSEGVTEFVNSVQLRGRREQTEIYRLHPASVSA